MKGSFTKRKTRTTYKPLKTKKHILIVHRYYTVKTNTLKYVLQSKGVNILNNLSLKSKKMNICSVCGYFGSCQEKIKIEISDILPLVQGEKVLKYHIITQSPIKTTLRMFRSSANTTFSRHFQKLLRPRYENLFELI